jgi:hypothetical protein
MINAGQKKKQGDFLAFINERAGLLVESGDGLYRFVHLSFQEYFTALYWFEQELDKMQLWEELYKPLIPNSHYNEVLLLLFSMMVHGGRKKSAELILRQSREWFWSLIEVDPGTIHRGMRITEYEKKLASLNRGDDKGATHFLQFSSSTFNDCLYFETHERDSLVCTFQSMELYFLFSTVDMLKRIYEIQKETNDYDNALIHALALDCARVVTLKLARDLSNALVCTLALNRTFGFDLNLKASDFSPLELSNTMLKLSENCQIILEKTPEYVQSDHSTYNQFSSLVLLHMGFILFFRWRFLEQKLPGPGPLCGNSRRSTQSY